MATSKEQLQIIVKAQGVKKTRKQLKQLEKQSGLSTTSFAKFAGGIAGVSAALYAGKEAFDAVIQIGGDFEQSMANLEAISGATGAEFASLESQARDLGASTQFTASEIGELQTELAKLGFPTDEILGMTGATSDLAASIGSELGASAAIVGATMNQFGLTAEKTSSVTDTMAAAFSGSALDLDKFTNSMTYVGPIASGVGVSLEATTAVLGTLANSGIDGSIAGTALKSVFLDLGNSTSKLGQKLGYAVKDNESLTKALEDLSKASFKEGEMLDLVGKRALPAFQILLNGVDDVADLTEALENSGGAAQMMAEIQLDTLQGKMKIMNSATEGLAIALFDHLSPGIKEATESFTDIIGSMTDYIAISTSEKIAAEQSEFNNLMLTLRDVNLEEENRKKIIFELQTKYGDYLGNIDLEVASYDDLTTAMGLANDKFMDRIRLEAHKEAIVEKEKEIAKLFGEQLKEAEKFNRIKQNELSWWELIMVATGTSLDQSKRYKDIQADIPNEIRKVGKELAALKKTSEILAKIEINPVDPDLKEDIKEVIKVEKEVIKVVERSAEERENQAKFWNEMYKDRKDVRKSDLNDIIAGIEKQRSSIDLFLENFVQNTRESLKKGKQYWDENQVDIIMAAVTTMKAVGAEVDKYANKLQDKSDERIDLFLEEQAAALDIAENTNKLLLKEDEKRLKDAIKLLEDQAEAKNEIEEERLEGVLELLEDQAVFINEVE